VAVYAPGARKAAKAHPVAPSLWAGCHRGRRGRAVMVTEAADDGGEMLSSTFMARFRARRSSSRRGAISVWATMGNVDSCSAT